MERWSREFNSNPLTPCLQPDLEHKDVTTYGNMSIKRWLPSSTACGLLGLGHLPTPHQNFSSPAFLQGLLISLQTQALFSQPPTPVHPSPSHVIWPVSPAWVPPPPPTLACFFFLPNIASSSRRWRRTHLN